MTSKSKMLMWAFGLVAWGLFPADALAWQCGRVPDNSGYETGPGLLWPTRALSYAVGAQGTSQLSQSESTQIVAEAFATWQNVTLRFGQDPQCATVALNSIPKTTDVVFTALAPTQQDYAGYNHLSPEDNLNAVLFRDSEWPYPLVGDSSDLMALTTTTYNPTTGEILDADIEVNTHDYLFSTGDTNVTYDLLNTMTHEVGHFLGFAHSDDTTATMYGSTDRGDTLKRELSCDDATIMWYRYPAGTASNACGKNVAVDAACGFCAPAGVLFETPKITVKDRYDGYGGCHCQSGPASLWAGLPALALMVRRRRKRAPKPATRGPGA